MKSESVFRNILLAGGFAVAGSLSFNLHAEENKLTRLPDTQYELQGVVRDYVDSLTKNWLLKMPDTNPAILEMLVDRDKQRFVVLVRLRLIELK